MMPHGEAVSQLKGGGLHLAEPRSHKQSRDYGLYLESHSSLYFFFYTPITPHMSEQELAPLVIILWVQQVWVKMSISQTRKKNI